MSYKQPQSGALILEDEKLEKIINYIMLDGKKSIARKILADTMKEIKSSGHMNAKEVIFTAIENASPSLMVKSKRVWGAVYQIPLEIPNNKKMYFACKWIIDAARTKKGKPMAQRLSEEFLAAYSEQWAAVRKKEDAHKMAEANKAFAYMAKYVK